MKSFLLPLELARGGVFGTKRARRDGLGSAQLFE